MNALTQAAMPRKLAGVAVGETATVRAAIGDLPTGASNPFLRWNVEDPPGADPIRSEFTQDFTRAFTYDTPGSRTFYVGLFFTAESGRTSARLSSKVTVTWADPGN